MFYLTILFCFWTLQHYITSAITHTHTHGMCVFMSGMTWRNRTNGDRLNPEELWQCLQYASRKVAGRFLESSWRRWHSSSGFSLSQFVLFLHVIPDRLDDDEICCQSPGANKNLTGLLQLNGKINVWKCKLIFPSDTLQQKIEITNLKPFFSWWKY